MPAKFTSVMALLAIFFSLFSPIPVHAAALQQSADDWTELAPGVGYKEFSLPGPVQAYVARMKIAGTDGVNNFNNTLETAIGRGKLGNLETVRGMAARYDDAINFWGNPGENGWGNRSDILVAVNGSYFGGTDTPENGMVQSGWYVKRFMDLGGGSGLVWNMNRQVFIDDCVIHQKNKQTIRILDSQGNLLSEVEFAGINSDRNSDNLILFTPQFGVQTPDRNDGVEIVVQLSRPLLIIPPSGNSVVGKITEIRDRTGSTPIPFDSVILSAGENLREALLPAAQIGATLQINQEITSLNRDCESSETHPWTKAYASLGAALHLLESGTAYPPVEDATRAPRTAIAFDDTFIYLIVVDGRQPDFSIGMTFQELADFILNILHAQNAVAQDGGGSSTMVVNGSVVNRPSDVCHMLFLPMVSKPGSPVISRPSLLLEENFEPPSRLQYGCERRVANAMMIARISPKEVSSLFDSTAAVFTTMDAQLRLGPGTNYPAYQIVPAGRFGEIVADANGFNGVRAKGTYWWKVNFYGKVGWMAEGVIASLAPRYSSPTWQH